MFAKNLVGFCINSYLLFLCVFIVIRPCYFASHKIGYTFKHLPRQYIATMQKIKIWSFLAVLLLISMGLRSQSAREQLIKDHNATFLTPKATKAANYTAFRLPNPLTFSGQTIEENGEQFWTVFGELFHQTDQAPTLLRKSTDAKGNQHLTYQQQLIDPVFGGDITLHFDDRNRLYAANGFHIRTNEVANTSLPTRPTPLVDDIYEQAALNHFLKSYPGVGWQIDNIESVLVANALLGNDRDDLVYAKKIRVQATAGPQYYDLFLDLKSAALVVQIQGHCDAMERRVYNNTVAGNNLIWQEGDVFPGSLNTAQQNLVTVSGETYNLFFRTFGRDSYDDAGGTLTNVNNAGTISCPNATAGQNATFYCSGTTADDVIAHEWTHVYTSRINGLIYAWESGAINEGFSDVFGEVVDLLNSSGTDTNDNTPRTTCNESNNERWKVGEDATAFGGHLRDMYNPACKGDPRSMTHSNFHCAESDNGGVHTNSGVLNQAFALLVDGGSLNGTTVNGIGLTKATHLFFQAWMHYTSRVSTYSELGLGLQMAANDIMGQDLTALTISDAPAGSSGEIFTAADLQQLTNVLTATGMLNGSNCTSTPALNPNHPDVCNNPAPNFQYFFTEDWENGMSNWTINEVPNNPDDWTPKAWTTNDSLPDSRAGQGVFVPNSPVGDCRNDVENGYVDLLSPVINIPAEGSNTVLTFDHYFSIENNWDGGLLFMSINGGELMHVHDTSFLFNAYSGNLNTQNNDNPMAGKGSFTGSDSNSTSGSWGQSQVDINKAGAQAGDQIQLVWRMSYDGCNGWLGWYLDDITLGYCTSEALPVEWISFEATAQEKSILLKWETTAEQDNMGFDIMRRAANELNFKPLGFVAASNTPSGLYQWNDETAMPGITYYYQLKQQDLDGTTSYSNIVRAKLKQQKQGISIFPNPVQQGRLTLQWADAQPKNISIQTVTGQKLAVYQAVFSGEQIVLPPLPPGVYLLKSEHEMKRFVVR